MNTWKVASVCPVVKIGDIEFNYNEILKQVKICEKENVDIVGFPELSITGVCCGDLFKQKVLINKAKEALFKLVDNVPDNILVVVGVPIITEGKLINCAVSILNHSIVSISIKETEDRIFCGAKEIEANYILIDGKSYSINSVITLKDKNSDVNVAVEIGNDCNKIISPCNIYAENGADIVIHVNSNYELVGSDENMEDMLRVQSKKCSIAYIQVSAGINETSSDYVFAGHCYIYNKGKLEAKNKAFDFNSNHITAVIDVDVLRVNKKIDFYAEFKEYQLKRTNHSYKSNPNPFVPDAKNLRNRCEKIADIQAYAILKRLKHINCNKVVIGISGGLDSTLVLLCAVRAFDIAGYDRKNIIGITMPGFGTTSTTKNFAVDLMSRLNITSKTIDIKNAVKIHLEDIGHNENNADVAFENAQARERTQVLMDYANMCNALVLGTGDMSESALGWCTYGGDHLSFYNVNASIPKSLIRELVKWYNNVFAGIDDIIKGIVEIPISPELVPSKDNKIEQKTEDIVGPYELHDFFIYHMIHLCETPEKIFNLAVNSFDNYTKEEIKKWLTLFYKRFFSNQFKRSCSSDGVCVGTIGLSPRGGYMIPSDCNYTLWVENI